MTFVRPRLDQSNSSQHPKRLLPTMYDLPSEVVGEPGLPDEYHLWQAELLSQTFRPPRYVPDQYFVAIDLNLYYDPEHHGWYKRPDWFGVVGVSRFYKGTDLRMSYVTWDEAVNPTIIVELLSPGTEADDLGEREQTTEQPRKWDVYEQILKIPYYVTFNRYTNDELRVFRHEGDRYQQMVLSDSKRWIPEIELGLGLWNGSYRGKPRRWLRWYDAEGNWIPTEAERTEQAERWAQEAQQQAEQERQQREAAEQRAEELAQRLRELGVEP
jgi:Uma2 family endonuclease